MHHFFFEMTKGAGRQRESFTAQELERDSSTSYKIFQNPKCNFVFEEGPLTQFFFDEKHERGIYKSGFISEGPDWLKETKFLTNGFDEFYDHLKKVSSKEIANSCGQFVVLAFDCKHQEAICFTSGFSNIRIFHAKLGENCLISNSLGSIHFFAAELFEKLDEQALCQFMLSGRIYEHRTLFSNISCLPIFSKLTIQNGTAIETYSEVGPIPKKSESLDAAAARVFRALKNAVEIWSQSIPLKSINFSGGVDSRAIVYCLPEKIRSNILFTTTVQPHLTEATDRDAILAKRVAQSLGLHHQWVFPQGSSPSYSFLVAPPDLRPALTGCTGGEFLGGLGLTISTLPSSLDELNERILFLKQKFSFSEQALQNALVRAKAEIEDFQSEKMLKNEFYALHFSSRSIRDSLTVRTWAAPYTFGLFSQSPFWDANLIREILRTPIEHIRGAKLYARIFQLFISEALEIPFHSHLCEFQPQIFLPTQEGIHPKYRAELAHPESNETDCLQQIGNFIQFDLEKRSQADFPEHFRFVLNNLGTMFSDLKKQGFSPRAF